MASSSGAVTGSAPTLANRRLQCELAALQKSQNPQLVVRTSHNILQWHFIFHSLPRDTPYHGACYHGKIVFTEDYPDRLPSIVMRTPSGRFEVDVTLCLNRTDYHPDLWHPVCSAEAILVGLLSLFISDDEVGKGGLERPYDARRELAEKSWEANAKDADFRELFPDFLETSRDRPRSGSNTVLERPAPTEVMAVDEQAESDEETPDHKASLGLSWLALLELLLAVALFAFFALCGVSEDIPVDQQVAIAIAFWTLALYRVGVLAVTLAIWPPPRTSCLHLVLVTHLSEFRQQLYVLEFAGLPVVLFTLYCQFDVNHDLMHIVGYIVGFILPLSLQLPHILFERQCPLFAPDFFCMLIIVALWPVICLFALAASLSGMDRMTTMRAAFSQNRTPGLEMEELPPTRGAAEGDSRSAPMLPV